MAIRRYTRDELLHLRQSPLVQKPENLPAIEQWIEYVYVDKDSREKLRIPHSESQSTQAANSKRQPQAKAGGDGSPMGNFGAGLRPSLISRSSASRGGEFQETDVMEGFRRRLIGGIEDISLGPPRTMFPSSRNVSKLSDFGDQTSTPSGDAAPGNEQEAPRSRFFTDRPNRKGANEKDNRDNRESWTSAREKRAVAGDEEHRPEGRYNRRDREHDSERRNGYGEKPDRRWGHKEDRPQNGERQGGWRERDRERKDRDWDRGGQVEKEPEWMEDPAPPNAEDDLRTMGMPRNQEQFQKWKEAMSGKKPQVEDANPAEAEPASFAKEAVPAKPTATLKLDGIVDKPFGGWGDSRSSNTPDSAPTPAKTAPGKSKGSRFASMFKDTSTKEETPPAETADARDIPGPPKGSAEDVVGFNRILQMLGNTGVSQSTPEEVPSSPPAKPGANGTKQKSRFTGFFDQAAKGPERIQSPPEAGFKPNESDMYQSSRGVSNEANSTFGAPLSEPTSNEQIMRGQAPSNAMSPEPMPPSNGNREQQQQHQSQRMNDIFLEQPPSRGAATPDVTIQNLLASQRAQRQQGQDKNSEFLLNLLQTKGTRPSSQQARLDSNFPLWLDQPPNVPEPHAPKPRAPPPPGLFEDQLLRNAPPEPPRQEKQPMPGNEMQQRRPAQRAPPGFYDEQNAFMQQQQQQQTAQHRNFTDPPQHYQGRRMSGHPNLLQMQVPQQQHQFPGQPPPEFLQSPGSGQPQGQAPPPGFNPHMPRHPPGFHNIPNIFQPPQQQQQQGREPPGFPGRMPGSAGGMQSPPNVPPGFFGGPQGVPPGFMQMRSPTEGMPAGGGQMGRGGRGFDGGFDGGMGGPRR